MAEGKLTRRRKRPELMPAESGTESLGKDKARRKQLEEAKTRAKTQALAKKAQDSSEQDELSAEHRLYGFIFFLVVVCALIYGAFATKTWLQDEQQLPVQDVVFSGERLVLDDQVMEAQIRESQQGSFFALDVNEVHDLMESMPWVYRASVRKRWPNSLHIYLVEQKPMAIWNQDLLLNTQGEVFDGGQIDQDLPQLFGPGGSEKTALAGYNAMQSLLAAVDLKINALFLSERFAWQLELNNGIKLNVGRQKFIDRLQNFIDIFPLLKSENKAINYIDLRYDIGLAVGWQENVKKEQEITENND